MPPVPVIVVILAAQRVGVVNPLAARAGVSHKCLVPICGRPLIAHVLESLVGLPAIAEVRIVLEPDGQAEIEPHIGPFRARGLAISLVDSDAGILGSVYRACGDDDGPFIITTADNVLVTPAALEEVRAAMRHHDGVIAVTTREAVRAVHEQGQRRFYEMREAGYANCNLYGLANRKGFAAAGVFREGGQFQKSRMRMIRAFGLFNIMLMMLKLVTLRQGLRRLGRRFDADLLPLVFDDGTLAIDVDNERTYAIAEWVLAGRQGMDIARPVIDAT